MNYLKIFIIVTFAISFSACWSANEKQTKENKAEIKEDSQLKDSESKKQDDFEEVKERLEKHIENSEKKEDSKISDGKEVKPADGKALSPTETLKEFDAATIAKDVERIKKVITMSSLEYFEKEAKKQGLTFKQMVEQPSQMPTVETPETRNEKIDGNKATVEAKNRFLGTFDKYPLVKEDGVWKVAYDRYLKQKIDELNKGAKPVK